MRSLRLRVRHVLKDETARLRELRLASLAALTDACVSWANARGLHELTLTVVAGNDPALRAYRAAGFVVRGETTWSEAGRTLDELIMSRPV